jgi:hypothetical protein
LETLEEGYEWAWID